MLGWAQKRAELVGLLRGCFVRVEPWLQAGKYVAAVASGIAERNGWTIAEQAGDRTPQRTQRLLNRAVWDTFAAMGVVRRFAVAGLDQAARHGGRNHGLRIGAIDETSQAKQGSATGPDRAQQRAIREIGDWHPSAISGQSRWCGGRSPTVGRRPAAPCRAEALRARRRTPVSWPAPAGRWRRP